MRKHAYYCNCVSWPQSDVHRQGGLVDMIDEARQITRRTFFQHVDAEELRGMEESLGYATRRVYFTDKYGERHSELMMADDPHVSYHRSKLHGKTVYYFRHSGIEFVFT